ncbi:fungal-specific transcription factor domain-containing protein [Plectosphaerella plurivora]|uniref:Fungal-specific transcription factor domain-containing protein n=1 Tax=Plectosphaerella plurivora TaxID=936078 RepID=A0A9P8VL86_9PEZI|nr:fungal-specific transcription factor domain-containing protein [Plectosphaerella plurivora]
MSSEAWINLKPAEAQSGTSPPDPGRKRVRNACARCRRQKLKIFRTYRFPNHHSHDVDAIPDAAPAEDSSIDRQRLIPVSDIIGVSFPPQDVSHALLQSYIDAMHWYLTVFDESSLLSQLEPIFRSGLAEAHQKPLLMLALVVLVIGIRFRNPIDERLDSADVERAGETLVEAAQKGYLFSMEMPTVESVAFSFLLSCHYTFSQQPNLSAIAMDAAVNAAQAIGLHQESTWGTVSFVERQIRRRVWWTVFTGATYMALTHGRPSRVSEESCNVQPPEDLEGDVVTLSGSASLEVRRHDGRTQPLSLSSYVRYRNQIYIIAASISRHVDASRSQQAEVVAKNTRRLHQRLLEWEKSVPPELQLETYAGCEYGSDRPHQRMFAMQAMALQMAYDNIQLALARPFVPEKREPTATHLRACNHDLRNVSLQQCFTSAMRTSMIGNSSTVHILRSMENSPINIHLGVHAFAAGVVLGSLALRSPVLPEAQDCKRGIVRIIQAPRAAGLTAQVWVQASAVLTDLLHVVASEEVAALLSEQDDSVRTRILSMSPFGKPPDCKPVGGRRFGTNITADRHGVRRGPWRFRIGRFNCFR